MGAHYCCTTDEGVAEVIARTAPPAEPLELPDDPDDPDDPVRLYEGDSAQALERVLRVCDPFAFLRLRDDLRREVLSYVVEVSKDVTLRRIKAAAKEHDDDSEDQGIGRGRPVTFASKKKKFLRGPPAASAAAAFETLRWHLMTRAVCTAVNGDIEAIVQRSGSTASGRAWLEHLYCRRYVGAHSAAAVAAELRARAKLGRIANTTRELYVRAAENECDGYEATLLFHPPSNWPAQRRNLAMDLLPLAYDEPRAGPALAHGRVLTVDEANEKMPGDPELLKMLATVSFESVLASLREMSLTLVAVSVQVVHRGPRGSTPSDEAFDALDSALDRCFGDLATRGEHWTTSWTNGIPIDYDEFQRGPSSGDDLARFAEPSRWHDPARPPLTALRDVYAAGRSSVANIQLTCEEFAGKCVALVDVEIPEGATSSPQIENSFAGDFRFIGPHVAAKCHTGSARYANATLKLATEISVRHDNPEGLGHAIVFLPLVPGVFDAVLNCHIPGMN